MDRTYMARKWSLDENALKMLRESGVCMHDGMDAVRVKLPVPVGELHDPFQSALLAGVVGHRSVLRAVDVYLEVLKGVSKALCQNGNCCGDAFPIS